MDSSVDDILLEDEEIEETVRPSRADSRYLKYYISAVALSIIVSVVILGFNSFTGINLLFAVPIAVFPLLLGLDSEIKRRFVSYHFTDRRVVVEKGVLNRNFYSIDYGNVTHLETEQPIQKRIFDVGDMHLHAAGEQTEEITLSGVKNPDKYRRKINSHT